MSYQQDILANYSAGLRYKSGLASLLVIQNWKTHQMIQNPKGTLNEKLRCKYHHSKYCDVMGHRDGRIPLYKIKTLNVSEREIIKKYAFKESIEW